jgi:branched-chain amino acid transport system permease protein
LVDYASQILILVSIFAILACSLNLTLGYAGTFSLAHAAFFGTGAYAAAKIQVDALLPWPAELIVAVLAAGALAAVSGYLVARLESEQVIVATLALQLVLTSLFMHATDWTGGSYGVYGIPPPTLFGYSLATLPALALYTLVVAAAVYLFCRLLMRSPLGLALRAGRDDATLARSYGRIVGRQKIGAFTIAGALAGLAGGLYGSFGGYIEPGTFGLHQSVAIVAIVAVGGLANLTGSVLGSAVLVSIPQMLLFLPGTNTWVPHVQLMLYGIVLLLLTMLRPAGLLTEQPVVRNRRRRAPASNESVVAGEHGNGDIEADALAAVMQKRAGGGPAPSDLEVFDVSKSFGGLKALNSVSLTIPAGAVTALIGPNGAGKSTLFNVITGYESADGGRVQYRGTELLGQSPPRIARLGITRTFQDLRLFFNFTALENLAFPLTPLAAERTSTVLLRRHMMSASWGRAVGDARDLLIAFGLEHIADRPVRELSYGESKLLAVAALYGRGSPVVLLDELAAGLDQQGVQTFSKLVRAMAAAGQTVCLVEHNLDFVWATADEVIVMHHGEIFAKGTPEAVRKDRAVAEAYFGSAKVGRNA